MNSSRFCGLRSPGALTDRSALPAASFAARALSSAASLTSFVDGSAPPVGPRSRLSRWRSMTRSIVRSMLLRSDADRAFSPWGAPAVATAPRSGGAATVDWPTLPSKAAAPEEPSEGRAARNSSMSGRRCCFCRCRESSLPASPRACIMLLERPPGRLLASKPKLWSFMGRACTAGPSISTVGASRVPVALQPTGRGSLSQ
mmetsp:Transcript_62805/g.161643  ORF Transcript_62805/g.161643 Transcript_62805/m.161643 type:complete len:201 (-) Transcript_62805:12-614(-)